MPVKRRAKWKRRPSTTKIEALARSRLQLLLKITQEINEADDFRSALEVALRNVCESTGWDYAEAWVPSADGTALERSPVCYGLSEAVEEFRNSTVGVRLSPGAGLIGRVWSSKRPEWIPDVSVKPGLFYRYEAARRAGLKAAFGLPIVAAGRIIAVLAFFMLKSRAEDKQLVELVSAIAAQLGSVLQHKKAEEALRESEERYRQLVDLSPYAIFLNHEGRFFFVNNAALELFGASSPDQLIGKPILDRVHPDYRALVQERMLRMMERGTKTPLLEQKNLRLDGTEFDAEVTAAPLIYQGRRMVQVVVRDITERKRAEEDLRKARDELELRIQERTAELAKSNEALRAEIAERKQMEAELLLRHRELSAHQRISEIALYGESIERAFQEIAKEISEATLFPSVTIGFYDDVQEKMVFKGMTGIPMSVEAAFSEAPADETLAGTVVRTGQTLVEINALARSDHPYTTLHRLGCQTYIGVPIRSGPRVIGVLSLMRPESVPVDDRLLREANGFANHIALLIERKQAESWLKKLIETTQEAVISIDSQGRIVLFNPAAEQMFGYSAAEIRGANFTELLGEPYAGEYQRYFDRRKGVDPHSVIGRVRSVAARRKKGELFPAELSVTEVATQEEVRYAAFVRDVSEKTKLQEQLIESERLAAIGATAAKLAHEIGNPLNGMYMTAQLLERRLAKHVDILDETVKPTLRTLMDEIARLNQLLAEFRSLSRRERYDFRPTQLSEVAAEIIEMERARYQGLKVRVEQDFPPDLPPVHADREKLKQALLNLCKNAVEAMPQGGTLALRARNSGRQVILEVADTGLGIPADVDVFEPFATTKAWGTGLGLVIVRQILTAHGGTVSYTSERGRGTVFRLTLPLSPPADQPRYEG